MLVALGKGLEIVVSHRSKSPNDDMEAHVALAANALGLKAGGGANTERLVKYQAVAELLAQARRDPGEGRPRRRRAGDHPEDPRLRGAHERGHSDRGRQVEVGLPAIGLSLAFKGATPLGTSAGSGEAIHLVDATVEYAERKELIDRYPALFRDVELGVYAFQKGIDEAKVRAESTTR